MRQEERLSPDGGGTYLKPIALVMLTVLAVLVVGILAALLFSREPATAGSGDASPTFAQSASPSGASASPSGGASPSVAVGQLPSPLYTFPPASLPPATSPSPTPEPTKAAPTAPPATAAPTGGPPVTPVPVAGDERDEPIVIGAIPATVTMDSRAATSRRNDPDCGGNASSVWFSHTPLQSRALAASTYGSNYDTVLHVGVRGEHGIELIDCVDDSGGTSQSAIRFDAQAGVTYLFMVGAYGHERQGRGGDLVFNLDEAPPALGVSITIDGEGTFDGSGAATISGSASCSTRVASASVEGQLTQRVGRLIFHGWGYASVEPCGPRGRAWTMTITSDDGTFGEESATVRASIWACDDFSCGNAEAVSSVTLYPSDPPPASTPSPPPGAPTPSPSPAP